MKIDTPFCLELFGALPLTLRMSSSTKQRCRHKDTKIALGVSLDDAQIFKEGDSQMESELLQAKPGHADCTSLGRIEISACPDRRGDVVGAVPEHRQKNTECKESTFESIGKILENLRFASLPGSEPRPRAALGPEREEREWQSAFKPKPAEPVPFRHKRPRVAPAAPVALQDPSIFA